MLKKLRATASSGRLFPERAKRAQEILIALDKRKQVKATQAKVIQQEYTSPDIAMNSPIVRQRNENLWQRGVNILHRMISSLMKRLPQIPNSNSKITKCATPTDV